MASSFLADLSKAVNDNNTNSNGNKKALATRSAKTSTSLVSTTNMHNGTVQLFQGKLKDGTSVAGVYSSGVARDNKTVLHLNFCLDNSGSMCHPAGGGKTRLQVVLACMERLCKSPMMQDQDYLALHTCNGDVRYRAKCPVVQYDHDRLQRDLAAYPGNTSSTRLWDGVLTSYMDMKKYDETHRDGKKVLRYLLAFTDGGDNASKTDLDRLAQTLAKPGLANFHVVVIAAGLHPSDNERLQKLLEPQHCRLIAVNTASQLDITQAFEEAMSHIRMLMVRLSTGEQQILTHHGSKEGAAHFEQMAAKHMAANMSSIQYTDVTAAIGAAKQPRRRLAAGSSK